MNIAEAAASPSVVKTLERFVLSSLSDARKWSGGKYKTVYHFDSKYEMIRQTQERFPEVAAKTSTVQIGNYVTNWKAFKNLAPQKQPDGSFIMSRTTPPTFKMPLIVTHKDTGAFVKALIDIPPGKDILAVSEYMTFPDWMEIWGRVLGVKASYKQLSNEEFFEGIPEAFTEELRDGFDYIHEFGFDGGDPDVLHPEQVRPALHVSMRIPLTFLQLDFKVPVTSMEDYIRSEDWSSVLNA